MLPTESNDGVLDSTPSAWVQAYETARSLESGASSPAAESTVEPYVRLCARLLANQATRFDIPILTVDGEQKGRVLTLWIDVVDDPAGLIFLHPEFEWNRNDFDADFLKGMAAAWQLAGEKIESGKSVFWHITEADGRPMIGDQQKGASASAAAFRAFWHIRRALRLDPDVFVLASCAAEDRTIADVGELGAKITAIQNLKLLAAPTIVIAASAKSRTRHDHLTVTDAARWAEVMGVASTTELAAVRSCTARAVIAYLEQLAKKLDETPWKQNGKDVLLSDVHVPPRVWKDDTSFRHTADDGTTERERDWRPPGYEPAGADREVAPRLTRERPKIPLPWATAFQRQQGHPIVVVGGPGFGKTSLLHWTAREMALASLIELHDRSKGWSDVRWPIVTSIAAWLGKGGEAHDALCDAANSFSPLSKTNHALRRAAVSQVIEDRLIGSTEHTHLFLDALDQVAATQVKSLSLWLGHLPSLTPRLVISVRQAALTTHLSKMPFSRPTILEAAALTTEEARALAAKWLDPVLAARLEAHLRAQPAMSVVADSPLLLTLACRIIARKPDAELPETAAYLYRDLMHSLAHGEWLASTEVGSLHADALLTMLRPMAWRLFSRSAGQNRFSHGTLVRALNKGDESADPSFAATIVQLCRFGFLENDGNSEGEAHFQFRHTTFLEFLAAHHLALEIDAAAWKQATVAQWCGDDGWQQSKIREILDANAFEPAWEPLIVFAAGLVKEPDSLIEILAERKKDDLFRHRLGLLCKCYMALSPARQDNISRLMNQVFDEILRIARRCAHDDSGHRKRWLDWVETLLPSPHAARQLCDRLIAMGGRYHGWAVPLKVWELLEKRLIPGRVPECVIDSIAHVALNSADMWVKQAARLALGLASREKRTALLITFGNALQQPATPYEMKVNLAEAVSLFGDDFLKKKAGELLVSFVRSEGIEFGARDRASGALIGLLQTSLAPVVASILVDGLLNPARSSQANQFWLAWRIIGWAESEPNNQWSAVLLTIVLFADKDDDERLRLWAAQVLSKRVEHQLQAIAFQVLTELIEGKRSHVWVLAARWLMEHGSPDLEVRGRDALFTAAIDHESHHQKEATAELLNMGAISPIGEPIQDAVREAILREIGSHGQKYGPLLDVSAAGLPEGNLDLEFFEGNPAAVIKRLHTFNGPSSYDRKRDDPNEEEARHRYRNPQLLRGTRYWPDVLRCAKQAANECGDADRHGHLGIVLYGATGGELLSLLQRTFTGKPRSNKTRHRVLDELHDRGWRVRLLGRQVVVLRSGQEEPRAEADFGS